MTGGGRSAALTVLLAALVPGGCATVATPGADAPARSPGPLRLTPYPYNSDVRGNDLPVEIGRFDVPAVREAGHAEDLFELGFVRYPAAEGVEAPPVVFLSRETRPSIARQELYGRLRTLGDVVVLNRRGYGFSSPPPPCPGRITYPFERPLLRDELLRKLHAYAEECFAAIERRRPGVSAYAASQVPGDLADLARALEAERIVLIAEGPMAAPALAAIELHPRLVERAIFVNPDIGGATGSFEGSLEGSLDDFLAALDGLRTGQAGSLPEDVGELRRDLAEAPVQVTVGSRSGRDIPLSIGELDFELIVAQAIAGGTAAWSRLAAAVESARRGDTALLGELALELRARVGQPSPMELLDAGTPASEAASSAAFANYWPAAMAMSSTGQRAGAPRVPASALVVTGTLYPHGNAAEQRNLAARFERSIMLTVRNGSRDLLEETPEIAGVLGRFIAGEEVRADALTAPAPDLP